MLSLVQTRLQIHVLFSHCMHFLELRRVTWPFLLVHLLWLAGIRCLVEWVQVCPALPSVSPSSSHPSCEPWRCIKTAGVVQGDTATVPGVGDTSWWPAISLHDRTWCTAQPLPQLTSIIWEVWPRSSPPTDTLKSRTYLEVLLLAPGAKYVKMRWKAILLRDCLKYTFACLLLSLSRIVSLKQYWISYMSNT